MSMGCGRQYVATDTDDARAMTTQGEHIWRVVGGIVIVTAVVAAVMLMML